MSHSVRKVKLRAVPAAGQSARSVPPAPRPRIELVRPVTLVEQIVEALVRAAAEGRFLPGDRLNEIEIARELNVSRVPVREALRLLESQGIAVKTPTARGLCLMPVDARHLHDIVVVRTSLEQLAARTAVAEQARNPAALAGLEAALADMERATQRRNGYEQAKTDTAFHRALCSVGGNQVLMQIWETLSRKLTIIFGLATLQKGLPSIYREHVELYKVIKRGDLAEIDRMLHEHIIEMVEDLDLEKFIRERRKVPLEARRS